MTPAAGIRYVPFKDGATLKTLAAGLPWQYKPRMASRLNDLNVPSDWVTNIVLTGEEMSDAACCQIIDSVEWAKEVRGAGPDVGSFPGWVYWLAGGILGVMIMLVAVGYFER